MKQQSFLVRAKKFLSNIQKGLFNQRVEKQIDQILQNAEEKRTLVLDETHLILKSQIDQKKQTLEQQIQQKLATIQEQQQNISVLQSKVDHYTDALKHQETVLAQKKAFLVENHKKQTETQNKFNFIQKNIENRLELSSQCKKTDIIEDIKNTFVKTQTAEISRLSFEMQEQFKTDAQKLAKKVLQSIYYRYQPKFIWPKSSFSVEFSNQIFIEKHLTEGSFIYKTLLDGTNTTLSILETTVKNQFLIKIIGGFGVDKEIIRLTLEACRSKKNLSSDKILAFHNKYKNVVKNQISHMGYEAAKVLGLQKIHPELLKLIGALNFRTSHRQNQYYHSLEVAMFAGMIADELGLDSKIAKRAGLLHDIGKVLDYKLEGSHAVISADYAAKYHENEAVVDTILAHHDDKIVETPYAFILKAADAMSGARPGARVDMEDGYNRRLDSISTVVQSFQDAGVIHSAIMHAGREVYVYVDIKKTPHTKIEALAHDIAKKLEKEVEYPGQIRVTVIRRMEVSAVA